MLAQKIFAVTKPELFFIKRDQEPHNSVLKQAALLTTIWRNARPRTLASLPAPAECIATMLGSYNLRCYLMDRCGIDFSVFVGLVEDLLLSVNDIHTGTDPGLSIHGNICPSNIIVFVSQVGVLFELADRGLYTLYELVHNPTVTRSYHGARLYAAPEVFAGRRCRQSDIFSIGVTLAAIVVEFLVVPGFDRIQNAEGVFGVAGRPVLIREAAARLNAVSDLPSHEFAKTMAVIIPKMCSADPAARPSIDELRTLLKTAMATTMSATTAALVASAREEPTFDSLIAALSETASAAPVQMSEALASLSAVAAAWKNLLDLGVSLSASTQPVQTRSMIEHVSTLLESAGKGDPAKEAAAATLAAAINKLKQARKS